MKRLSTGFIILSTVIIIVMGGCGEKPSGDDIISVNQLLGNPVKYLGREVTFQARVVTGEAVMGSFIVEDINDNPSTTALRLTVNFRDNLPSQGSLIEITGKMTIIGAEFIFSADKIEYIEDKM